MKKQKSVAVVIPIFKTGFTDSENISLQQWKKYLSHYDTFALCPENLQITLPGMKRRTFPSHFFSSVHSYSQLLLKEEFYKAFDAYDYILIYQLDALVLSDKLQFWVDKGYDYIGAPWWSTTIGFLTHPKGKQMCAGNGGLSLRCVSSMLSVLAKTKKEAIRTAQNPLLPWVWFFWAVLTLQSRKKWLKAPASLYPFNEDGFWSFEAQKYDESFTVAPLHDSLSFAFETHPEECFNRNGKKLPFGIHAWEKYDEPFCRAILDSNV